MDCLAIRIRIIRLRARVTFPLAMQNWRPETKGRRIRPRKWGEARSSYKCADSVVVLVSSRASR